MVGQVELQGPRSELLHWVLHGRTILQRQGWLEPCAASSCCWETANAADPLNGSMTIADHVGLVGPYQGSLIPIGQNARGARQQHQQPTMNEVHYPFAALRLFGQSRALGHALSIIHLCKGS